MYSKTIFKNKLIINQNLEFQIMNLFIKTTMICSLLILSLNLTSQKKTNAVKAKEATKETSKDSIPSSLFSALKFRSLGPALTSGRISDLAVNPNDPNHYFVAVASGGVWKTTNSGVTFDPVFDGEGSYSIGCLAMDPKNTNVLWVGTGENNNQRSVAYGDGIYKTEDGGKSWKNMGLKIPNILAELVLIL